MSRSSTRWLEAVPVSRNAASLCSGRKCSRLTTIFRYLLVFTAVSPNIWRMFMMPRPRTSSMSCSRAGQLPSMMLGVIWVNSGWSSATSRWPRLISSSASSLLPAPASPVISTPNEKISMNTPCSEVCGASRLDRKCCSRFRHSKPRRSETQSAMPASSQAVCRSVGQTWPWLMTRASGLCSMISAIASQRWRASRRSSQASSAIPNTCTLLGWMTLR